MNSYPEKNDWNHFIFYRKFGEYQIYSVKVNSHRTKMEAKAKILLDFCRLPFDIFGLRSHFRLVEIALTILGAVTGKIFHHQINL